MTGAGFLLILAAALAGVIVGLALAELTESDDFGPLEAFRRLRRRISGGPRLQESIFDSVRMLDGGQVPRRGRLICMHKGAPRRFHRTDSRGGPGWMSDTYEGECCPSCGKILAEKRIY